MEARTYSQVAEKLEKANFSKLNGFENKLVFSPIKIGEFSSFFKSVFGIGLEDIIPSEIAKIAKEIEVTSLDAILELDTKKGLSIEKLENDQLLIDFAITYDKDLDYSIVNISKPYISFRITSNDIFCEFGSNQIKFDETDLNLSVNVEIPSLLINASLMQGDLKPNGLANKYLGDLKTGNGGIEIDNITFIGAPTLDNYCLHLSVNNILNLHNKFTVKNFQADINYFGSQNGAFSILAYTQVEIGFETNPLIIQLAANYESSDGGKSWMFEGAVSSPIKFGDLIQNLCSLFDAKSDFKIPRIINDTVIDSLNLSFDGNSESEGGNSKNYHFDISLSIPIEGKVLSVELKADFETIGDGYILKLSGFTGIMDLALEINFLKEDIAEQNSSTILFSFRNENELNVGDFIKYLAPENLHRVIPELTLNVKDVFLGLYKNESKEDGDKKSSFELVLCIDLDIDAQLNLSKIPAIGKMLEGKEVGLDDIRVLTAVTKVSSDGLKSINSLIGSVGGIKEIKLVGKNETEVQQELREGVYLSTLVNVTGLKNGIPLYKAFVKELEDKEIEASEVKSNNDRPEERGQVTEGAKRSADNNVVSAPPNDKSVKPVGFQIGPFFLESLSLSILDEKLKLQFTGGLIAGPLGMKLIGFSAASKLSKFDPEFDLLGFELSLDKPPVSIYGMILKDYYYRLGSNDPIEFTTASPRSEGSNEESGKYYFDNTAVNVANEPLKIVRGYKGAISIGFKKFTLSAIGEFSQVDEPEFIENQWRSDGYSTFFMYGFLGAPLGGTAFLFVTGLSLGFGYNSNLILPRDPDKIADFPLLAVSDPNKKLGDIVASLKDTIQPERGTNWFAIGIRVESFKMIETFVVLSLKFGNELEIGISGIATLNYPPQVAPENGSKIPTQVACIKIGVVASYLPSQGVLSIIGAFLPGSFIINPQVEISGGFAMLAIMKDQHGGEWKGANAGDFILTIGGYGPIYQPKSYYPQVKPITLQWKLNENLSIKAQAYFAITPQAMMFGGRFEMNFHQGGSFSISVYLLLSVDFIIYWQPVHYLGHAHAELKVHARVDLWFIHASLSFDLCGDLTIWGPDFSGSGSVKVNSVVSFHVSVNFGDASKVVKKLSVDEFKKNLLPQEKEIVSIVPTEGLLPSEGDKIILNPKEASFTVNSVFPLKNIVCNNWSAEDDRDLNVKPLNNGSVETSQLSITLSDPSLEFELESITKNMPSAVWGNNKNQEENLVMGVLSGVKIKPKAPASGGEYPINLSKDDVTDELIGKTSMWDSIDDFEMVVKTSEEDSIRDLGVLNAIMN